MNIVIASGTPGTGKTALAKRLAKKLGFCYVDVNRQITKYKIYEGYDKGRRTKIVDVRKLNRFLINLIKQFKSQKNKRKYNGIIIDSHLSHYLPRKYVDFCIITKCSLKELNKRLKRKKFHKRKIRENLQAEIFDVCLNEARERKHRIVIVDTTKGFNINALAKQLGG